MPRILTAMLKLLLAPRRKSCQSGGGEMLKSAVILLFGIGLGPDVLLEVVLSFSRVVPTLNDSTEIHRRYFQPPSKDIFSTRDELSDKYTLVSLYNESSTRILSYFIPHLYIVK